MPTTTRLDLTPTLTHGPTKETRCPTDLMDSYQGILDKKRISWTEHHRLIKLLGYGGQGVVYLSSSAAPTTSRCPWR